MKNRKLYLFVLVITLIFVIFPSQFTEAVDEDRGMIAYVDVWAVFNVHPRKDSAEIELNKTASELQAELEEEAQGLSEIEQQELLNVYQSRLTEKEQELIDSILENVKRDISYVAEQKEIEIVLDKKNVIYGGYDLTVDVIDYIQENYNENNTVESSETGLEIDLQEE